MGEDVLRMSTDEIVGRARLLDNEIKVPRRDFPVKVCPEGRGLAVKPTYMFLLQIMRSEIVRISHEQQGMKDKIKVLSFQTSFSPWFQLLFLSSINL